MSATTDFRQNVQMMLNKGSSAPTRESKIDLYGKMFQYIADSASDYYAMNNNANTKMFLEIVYNKCEELMNDINAYDGIEVPDGMINCRRILRHLLKKCDQVMVPLKKSDNAVKNDNAVKSDNNETKVNEWKYCSDQMLAGDNAYKMINRAFKINLKDNFDSYTCKDYEISMDGDIAFVYFNNREQIVDVIDTLTNACGTDANYTARDVNTDEEFDLDTIANEGACTNANVDACTDYNTYSYHTDFMCTERSYKLLNRGIKSNFTESCGTFASPCGNYFIELDGNIGYIYFKSIEDTEFIKEVIEVIANIVGAEPNYCVVHNESGTEYMCI